ncbi:hypothetical protein [Deinococcus aluminii]|uniref:Uncharacterized protein n=1 Tax=Deinococcus aluminii TaxID=1656885 RepID=A0ABP9XDF8_9DEIO
MTATEQAQPAPPLRGICAHCDKPGTLYYVSEFSAGYFCPEHRADYALACAAGDDLQFLIKQACLAWLGQWGHLHYVHVHAVDEANNVAEKAMRDAISERGGSHTGEGEATA